MNTIDRMQQNPGEWFPVSLNDVRSIKVDFERRGIQSIPRSPSYYSPPQT
jgi:hypothetical protein